MRCLLCSDNGFQEVSFDPASNCLTFSSSTGGRVVQRVSVDIKHIFVSSSFFIDMITLRTNQLHLVPSGYLGSFRVSSWRNIKAELHSSLIHYRHHQANPAHENGEDSFNESLTISATSGAFHFDDSVFVTESRSLQREDGVAFVTQTAGPGQKEEESVDEIGLLQRYAERGYAFYKRLSDVSLSTNADLRELHDLAYDNLSKLNFIVNKHYYYRSRLSSPWMDRRTPFVNSQVKHESAVMIKARKDSHVLHHEEPRHAIDDALNGVVTVTGKRPSAGVLNSPCSAGDSGSIAMQGSTPLVSTPSGNLIHDTMR